METIDLNAVRKELLQLHKLLIEHQRRQYEKDFGQVKAPGQMYNLLVNDDSFKWLRSMSEVIVSIDEILEGKESKTNEADLVAYIKMLILPNEQGNEFSQQYHHALQNFPDALVEHGKLVQLLK